MSANKSEKRSKKFSWEAYRKDFSLSNFYWLAAITVLFILFSEPLISLWNFIAIQPLLQHCLKNRLTDFIFIIYLFFGAYLFFYRLRKGMSMSLNATLFFVTVLLIYFFNIRNSFANDFYFFRTGWLSAVAYADFFLISTLLIIVTYKSYFNPFEIAPSHLSLIDDNPSLTGYTDAYSRAAYAKSIAEHIDKTTTINSFAIAVVGEWGSGKTDFLLRLKDSLKENPDDNLVFDFNPWRVSKADAIVEEFFKTLSDQLKPFNESIHAKLKDYSKRILQTGKEIYYRLFDALINDWGDSDSIEKQYEAINKAITSLSKRVVIFIDDIDRLTGKEIMEVLRIIRNSANFSNVFFVVSIDQQYVINVLKGTKDFDNEEEYLKKVFQLVITLPAFKKDIFPSMLKQYLLTDDLSDDDKEVISAAIAKITTDFDDLSVPYFPAADHDNILEKLIDNSRDLKRFCNSFKIAFKILKEEVDVHDLMVLELIRNRNIEVYSQIRSRQLLDFDLNHSHHFIIHKTNWDAFNETFHKVLPFGEVDKLKSATEYLVTDVGYKGGRKFCEAENFLVYFSYQLFNLISLKDFRATIVKPHAEITKQFDTWYTEKKGQELPSISYNLTEFKDDSALENMVVAFMNVASDHLAWVKLSERLVFELRKMNHGRYFGNDIAKHVAFIKRLMTNSAIAPFDRARIAKLFLDLYEGKSASNAVLSRDEWQETMLNLFGEYLKAGNIISYNQLMSFYYFNKIKTEPVSRKVIMNPKASVLFKKHLTHDPELFALYVKHLVRPELQPYSTGGIVVFEPHLEQIFGNWKDFKTELLNLDTQDSDIQTIKRLALAQIDNYYTVEKGFVIKNKKEENVFLKMINIISKGE